MRKKIVSLVLIAALSLALLFALRDEDSTEPSAGGADASAASTTPADPFAAPPKRSVSGRVLGPDARAIAGATVGVRASNVRGTTDDRGRFMLIGLTEGAHVLDASAQGFISPGPEALRGLAVEVTQQPLTDVELRLRVPGTISGKILAGGRPVQGARIGLYYLFADGLGGRLEPFALDHIATSSADGTFTLSDLAPGRLRVLAETDAHALAESREVFLRDGAALRDLVLDLAPSSKLSVDVLDTAGDPVRADVTIAGGALMRNRTLRADAQGAVSFMNLPPGTLTVSAKAAGWREEVTAVELEPSVVTSHQIIMTRARGVLGRVLDHQGAPAKQAFVTLHPKEGRPKFVRVDDAGRFQWEEAPDGVYSAEAGSPYSASAVVEGVVPGREVTLTLGPGGSISGRVVGPSGQPVSSYTLAIDGITVDGARPYSGRSMPKRRIDRADGAFTYSPLRPGKYYIRAKPRAFADAVSQEITVRAGESVEGVEIVVRDAGRVVGVVRSAKTNAPLATASVQVFEPTATLPLAHTRTRPDGSFVLDGVAPGRRSLRVRCADHETMVVAGVEVREGASTSRDVTLQGKDPHVQFSFHGIGAVLSEDDRGVVIRDVMAGSPAKTFGLQSGDVIVSVDREDVSDVRFVDIIQRIRGEEGAPVRIEVLREGEGRVAVDVERGRVAVKKERKN
ncbi:MAG: carboxypeptidase regulatory-like domain-containing protein [Myxococcota bacterium]